MNKQQLEQQAKEHLYYYDIELIDNTVIFKAWSANARVVNHTTIKYTGRQDKREIYNLISRLIRTFDFSYYTEFNTKEQLREFLQ